MELMERESSNLDIRNKENLIKAFNNADMILSKNYLSNLEKLDIARVPLSIRKLDIVSKVRFYKITKLVYNKEESALEKLATVINAAYVSHASIATIIKSDGKKIDYYLGIINKNEDEEVSVQADILQGTFKSNFPGSKLSNLDNDKLNELIDDIFYEDEYMRNYVTSVSGIAALRLKDNEGVENYIQGLEKIVDSVKERCYTAILIGDPVENTELQYIRAGYESLYTELSPFLKTDLSFNESDSLTFTEGTTSGITDTVNKSISYTQNHSESNGWNTSKSFGESNTRNYGQIASTTGTLIGGAIGTVGGPAGALVGAGIGKVVGDVAGAVIGSKSSSYNETNGKSFNKTESYGTTNQEGNSRSRSEQTNNSSSEGNTRGRSIQLSFENRGVKTLLEKIDEQLERTRRCEDFGSFTFAAYFISNDASVNERVACSYNAIMKGEDSSIESSYINSWYDENKNKELIKYLSKFTHPVFNLDLSNEDMVSVTPASIVSGKELAIQIALPKKSIVGIPVVESTAFGRNISSLSKEDFGKEINLGSFYHMGECEDNKVYLDVESLAMHTFITGSTGSGKSNTIYNILDNLNNKNINFLVVEPAKGEYKNIFGHREDVTVLGTNPKKNKLLRINPFKFADDIHVLEHIDRLIEIFNVCWPMYAAMPAVLKDAIERAYIESGWDLELSENKYSNDIYPTFADVLIQLNKVVNESAFSEEVKGNYIGSLVTRVKSLTNGINGMIFNSKEVDNELLFDSNVIVDLSRVGSIETKSLIMGILIMRLQEHRMTQGGMNRELRHVTVLEEAHNILKRTSSEQSSEGANLAGKSVEMLANAIAEIRTYGEGFIIADQSPGLLDMSVIRNTNTKIILRLPELSDRELVGKSAGLNDDQIIELSKLENGVAAVYQNNWLEPILCKVNKFNSDEKEFIEQDNFVKVDNKSFKVKLTKILLSNFLGEKIEYDIDSLEKEIINSNMISQLKVNILNALKNKDLAELKNVSRIVYDLYGNRQAFKEAKNTKDINEWNNIVLENLDTTVLELDELYRNTVLQCIIREEAINNKDLEQFYFSWTEFMRGNVLC